MAVLPEGYQLPALLPVPGVKLGTACAGIKQTVKDDVLLMALPESAACAAVFTQNAFCAAPVVVAKAHLNQRPRWLLVNSGNA
ncbi:MAG: bifunctional ornithine acetyltransferase/N-acetylglutamate synthase, partial [Methylomonas sp.]